MKKINIKEQYAIVLSNILITIGLLTAATGSSLLLHFTTKQPINITIVYMLALVLIARFTSGYYPGIIASLIGVIYVNYLFTYPYFELDFTLTGYPITFFCMLAVALTISTTTTYMKKQAKILTERETLLIEAEKEKMRANLLRAISHDLRTPLTSMIGASATYLENQAILKEEEKTDLVSHIYEDSNWLLNMVENLLSVTRIHNNSATVTKSFEPVEEVVSEAVFRLKKRIPNAVIKVKVPDQLLMIPMDAILIEQVIINLLENAVIHANSIKPIEFLVEATDNSVLFHIIDYGIGIPEDKLDSIFDGYTSNQNNHLDAKKGMGIGLSICKTIILAHQGHIFAENHEHGTIFSFRLPMDGSNC